MKLTIYMALSIDGLITRGETDSDWVSKTDWEQFHSYIKANDAVIMGRKTMDQFGSDFPIADIFNIVLSKNKTLHTESETLLITDKTPEQIIEYANTHNLQKLLLIGGSETNRQFIKAGLIDEIVLSVHPLIIGEGLKLFGNDPLNVSLELLGTKDINSELVQIRYKVIK